MPRHLYLTATLLIASASITFCTSTFKKWQQTIVTQAKQWRAAGEYARTIGSHPVIPAVAGTVGMVGAGKALLDARDETDHVARKNFTIIGITSLLTSLDAELLAVDNYFAQRNKNGEGICRNPRSRLTHLVLGICRIVNIIAPASALWSEYEQAKGDAVLYGLDRNSVRLEYILKRVLPYLLPATISAARAARNLLHVRRSPRNEQHQLCELSPTNAPQNH